LYSPILSGNERYCNCPEAIASLEVEGDDLVLSHTIESAMRSKAQTSRLLESHTIIWDEHPHETPVGVVIFANRRHCICRTERMFAANDDIAVWCNRKVKRTDLRIPHLP
jgi:hypothetical protein